MKKPLRREENLDRMDISVADRAALWALHHMQLAANVQDLSVSDRLGPKSGQARGR
jgi:hypothetical protein